MSGRSLTVTSTEQAILNSLEGVCYICAFDGEILAVGEKNWREVVSSNTTYTDRPSAVAGTNIFTHISGPAVIDAYKSYFAAIESGSSNHISFTYRCDTPHLRREMRMNLSAIHGDGRPSAILSQSLLIDERERPPISLFDFERYRSAEASLPIVTLCSFCQHVKMDGAWVAPEQYYHHGGTDQVRISHGMCTPCYNERMLICESAS